MALGRGSLNVVYKTKGKKRDQKMVQPGTKGMHKMFGGMMMKDEEMKEMMKKGAKKMK